ncbi:hybrid sensor histidine kinase/response regulator [Limnovirga soli]|uniref:histidine kinase n=1 Tax=Limnovirga soli TaxID=2656915 RepID=A0A8J8FGM3_9BACT|nr:hybrid sensor histidine kinase/response regulator [Limnovirga soli]NNV57776.1 response regulator [Limnovirga soli]
MLTKQFYIILCLSLISTAILSQQPSVKFQHLQTENGLSQSNALTIIQDKQGFMWFGTRDGLNKYDGYKFTVYKNDTKDSTSISNNYITKIIESKTGELWISTWGGGLNCFNKNTGKFTRYKFDASISGGLPSDFLNTVYEDRDGNIWIGTEANGLLLFDRAQNRFIQFKHSETNAKSISDNFVQSIMQDNKGLLWIATSHGGLNVFDIKAKLFRHFKHDAGNENSIAFNDVYSLFQDSDNRIWVGTNGGGLDRFDETTGRFIHYKNQFKQAAGVFGNYVYAINEDNSHRLWIGTENEGLILWDPLTGKMENYLYDEVDNTSLSNNSVYSICKSEDGSIWVGTFAGGVNFIPDDNIFAHFKHNASANSLSSNQVLSIAEDGEKNIWIGTDGGGLNCFNPNTNTFTRYKHLPNKNNSICGNYILSVMCDKSQNLWIGTWGDGITVFNPKKNTYRHFKNIPGDPNSLSSNNAWNIYQDNDGEIWVATYGGGLNKYNPASNSFTSYRLNQNEKNGINSFKIHNVFDDGEGHLWISTNGGGINVFTKSTGLFKQYLHTSAVGSLPSNSTYTIFKDSKNKIWIATEAGLALYNADKDNFATFTTENGLPNNVIFGILEDDNYNLWISTGKGISRFNINETGFKNFRIIDGIQSYEFKENAFCKSSNGVFYFGGVNGFNAFNPDKIKYSTYTSPLAFTGFSIFNRELEKMQKQTGATFSKTFFDTADTVNLPYNIEGFSIEFASLNFGAGETKKYLCQLMGFDKKPYQLEDKNSVSYTNLDPGSYVFTVTAQNAEGQNTNKTITLLINITPPFWLTWWFKMLTLLMVAGSIFTVYRIRMNAIQLRQQKLQQLVAEKTHQLQLSTEEEKKARREAENANKAKSIFLATMSHELRTPMNGVIGMTSLLSKTELTSEQKGYADVIRVCGENLLNVINDILDFSKIESGNMELEYHNFDLRECIEEVMDVFAEKASKIGLDLVYQIDYNVPVSITGDRLRLRQILLNLVSNAIKFTKKGEIFVGVHCNNLVTDGELDLGFEVRDTGIGIPDDKLSRLFKAFSQVDSSTTRKYGGTGLGLIISQKLVTLMGGNIHVISEVDKGSAFTFNIIAKTSVQSVKTYVNSNMASLNGKRILIIDDNIQNLNILSDQLKEWKLIPVAAQSGREALEIAAMQPAFDLVLTDMKMPEMNGVEFAQHFKTKYPLVPIVLLSSLGDDSYNTFSRLFVSVLSKPIKQHTLGTSILNVFRNTSKSIPAQTIMLQPDVVQKLSIKYPLRILLAEDDMFNQLVAEQTFLNEGYTVDIAETGVQAVTKAKETDYDIIFMDIQMPEMDGFEATGLIRKELPKQPFIVAMTANAMQGDKEKCLQAGMNDYISKPINLEEFVVKLEAWAAKIHDKQSPTILP